jgi:hypothetical protein
MGARWIRMDCVENEKLINGSGGTLWGNAAASTKRDTQRMTKRLRHLAAAALYVFNSL